MEGVLKFNLPEEKHDFRAASQGADCLYALMDIERELRNATKYNRITGIQGDLTGDQADVARKLQETFYEILNDRGIHLEDII